MKKTLVLIVAVSLLVTLLAALYRAANQSDLPDDEWFEFENLPT